MKTIQRILSIILLMFVTACASVVSQAWGIPEPAPPTGRPIEITVGAAADLQFAFY